MREATADDVVVFTDENPVSGNFFGLLQRQRRDRPTIVRTDPLLRAARGRFGRAYIRAAFEAVDRIIVWAPDVARRYRESYGLPLEKMVAVRFHHTFSGYPISPGGADDFLFSGGNSMRDYVTLIEAVRGLPIAVRIATHWKPPPTLSIPPNVTMRPTTTQEFLDGLAAARFVVFPLETKDVRPSGQQSYLNAMALGKAVIVTDDRDATFYIDSGRTGILTPSGDVAALRREIVRLLEHPDSVRDIGRAAKEFALPIDQEAT